MTLNGVIAVVLLYFTKFDSFAGIIYVTVVEDRPAQYRLPLLFPTDLHCSAVSLR